MSVTVAITHPDKILFPEEGITKQELADYYQTVAPHMLPHLRGRPVTMERFHRGIGEAGFIQKDIGKGAPEWLKRIEVPKKGGTVTYPLIGDRRSLAWMANQNCITPHVWVSRMPHLEAPDLCVFDLDPSHEDPESLRRAALSLRDLLASWGLDTWVKTSGSRGFHIVAPLDSKSGHGEVLDFAHRAGAALVAADPEHLTMEFAKADRGGRIYVDCGRNGPGATFAAAYAVRARPGAPVSAPCTWEELESGSVGPRTFTLRNLPERLARTGDLWAPLKQRKQSLKKAAAR